MAQQRNYNTVIIQNHFRLDSVCALFLLFREGERNFPGISQASIKLWRTGTFDLDGKTWQGYAEEGVMLLGVGGSPFDEHPSPDFGDGKTENLSTTKLVAQELGIADSPLYRKLIEAITEHDLGQDSGDYLSLGNLIKLAHRNGRDQQATIQMVFDRLDDIVAKQARFLAARTALKADATTLKVGGRSIVMVKSDNDEMPAASRANGAAVLVQANSDGRVHVFSNRRFNVDLREVTAAVRYYDLKAQGRDAEANRASSEKLESPGQIELDPRWCYQQPGENLLNGSETADSLQPTKLQARFILDLVCKYVRFGESTGGERQLMETSRA